MKVNAVMQYQCGMFEIKTLFFRVCHSSVGLRVLSDVKKGIKNCYLHTHLNFANNI